MEPEIFAPGIVNTGLYTRDLAISKDGNEIYFCVADADFAAIFVTKCIDNHWTEPQALDEPVNSQENEFFPSVITLVKLICLLILPAGRYVLCKMKKNGYY